MYAEYIYSKNVLERKSITDEIMNNTSLEIVKKRLKRDGNFRNDSSHIRRRQNRYYLYNQFHSLIMMQYNHSIILDTKV